MDYFSFTPVLKHVSCFLQIVLLIAFMCITLLLASLLCLTLPGNSLFSHIRPEDRCRGEVKYSGYEQCVCHVCFSVHWPLADVLLDWKLKNPWAVHGSVWPVCLLAVYPGNHCAAGLDASRPHCHPTQSPGVDVHGECQWAVSTVTAALGCIDLVSPAIRLSREGLW